MNGFHHSALSQKHEGRPPRCQLENDPSSVSEVESDPAIRGLLDDPLDAAAGEPVNGRRESRIGGPERSVPAAGGLGEPRVLGIEACDQRPLERGGGEAEAETIAAFLAEGLKAAAG
jgi:hypothetical protein